MATQHAHSHGYKNWQINMCTTTDVTGASEDGTSGANGLNKKRVELVSVPSTVKPTPTEPAAADTTNKKRAILLPADSDAKNTEPIKKRVELIPASTTSSEKPTTSSSGEEVGEVAKKRAVLMPADSVTRTNSSSASEPTDASSPPKAKKRAQLITLK